jgi:hypothetical protein
MRVSPVESYRFEDHTTHSRCIINPTEDLSSIGMQFDFYTPFQCEQHSKGMLDPSNEHVAILTKEDLMKALQIAYTKGVADAQARMLRALGL